MPTISQKLYGQGLIDHLPDKTEDAGQDSAEPPARTTAQYIESVLKEIVSGTILLPSLPEVCLKFKDMLQRGPSVKEIAELLKKDVAISAKLISLSNTVMYRGAQENKNLEQAIGRLGLATTKKLVDAISQRAICNNIIVKYKEYVNSLWEHSLACAYAAQTIAELTRIPQSDEYFTLGLLHDIGKLILLQIVSKQEADGMRKDGVNTEELYQLLDKQHGAFGATLLKRWNFPEAYAFVAQHHNQLDKAGAVTRELAVVHCGNLLVKSMGFICLNHAQINLEDEELARVLKVNAESIAGVRQTVQSSMEGVKGVLG
jgi:putative nucleotidyltransferase with HDIG domain